MSGGFGLVAWPADYDVTGIMTFIVNQDGAILEKDTPGPKRARWRPPWPSTIRMLRGQPQSDGPGYTTRASMPIVA